MRIFLFALQKAIKKIHWVIAGCLKDGQIYIYICVLTAPHPQKPDSAKHDECVSETKLVLCYYSARNSRFGINLNTDYLVMAQK